MRRSPSAVLARLVLFALPAMAVLASACARQAGVVHMATTTSVESSGLLAVLLPAFEKDAGISVQAVAVGSGRALDILDRRDADVALTHDADAERRYLDRGVFGDYRKLMFNDFLIAGPADDPAEVRAATTAIDAMRRIAASSSTFASRADSSGTHSRELQLWNAAGRTPAGERLIETGQGMAPTLRIASERNSYVLTDRATFTQLGPTLRLAILSEGDPALLNTYAVTFRHGLTGDRLDRARRFFLWLADGRGRELIDGFAIRGQRVYSVWPLDRPRAQPEDLPRAR